MKNTATRLLTGIYRLRAAQQGVALLEFALILPIVLLLLFGGIEVARAVLFNQKITNATYGVADVITRLDFDQVPCQGPLGLNNVRNRIIVEMMRPFDFNAAQGSLVVSSIEASYPDPMNANDNQPLRQRVVWQWNSGGNASRIGTAGGLANGSAWPQTFRRSPNAGGMFDGDRIIAVEVFYTYRSFIPGIDRLIGMSSQYQVYERAFYRARFGNMSNLASGC